MLQRSNLAVLLLALLIYANPALSQLENNEFGEVKPTPVLKSNPQDVATVLVADINNRGAHGRFINIKPEIGLLKSTARTFIQDGIKTEYVTKVIGTTIDNGQYVQLLTTTSRVLYNSDNQQTKTVNLNAIDGNDDASFLNSPPSSPFLQNVDYIVPNNPYLVFPARNSRNNNNDNNNNIINYNNLNINDNQNEESEIAIKAEKLVESSSNAGGAQIPQPAKVIPEGNLPTYTVSHDGPIFEAQAPKFSPAQRAPKVITYEEELKEVENAQKILPSVTYFGFADFTTTVGDTVIIFSPSTAKPQIDKDHITSIKGEPTLNIQPTTTKQQHITFESAEPSQPVRDEPRFTPKIVETAMPTLPTTPEYKEIITTTTEEEQKIKEETTTEKESTSTSSSSSSSSSTTTQKTTQETTTSEEIVTTTNESQEQEEEEEDSSEETDIPLTSPLPSQKPIIRVVGITTPESIESSQVSSITTPKYSKPSEEDVQRILASLASQKVSEQISSVIDTSPISNAETKVLTGSSIIFFDYDEEFDITTQKTQIVTIPSTSPSPPPVTTTESESSEEEEDDDEQESTSVKQPEKKVEQETTTESVETIKPLTPRPADNIEEIQQPKGCSSTMLKTLTYLTTFYVPIDEIITTTSIKTSQTISSTVVPVECPIQPTSVVSQEQPLVTVKVVTEDVQKQEETTHAVDDKESENVTTVKATTQKPDITTMEIVTESSTVEEETTVENSEDEEDIEVIYKTLYTTYTYLTTFFQESTSTVSSRREVITNVITSTINANDFASLLNKFEPSKPDDLEIDIQPTQVDHGIGRPTEKFILPESDFIGVNQLLENEKVDYTPALTDDDIGNEIKTLYTTYTYFTTLFNDDKSEIATRTEVYTNIINPSSSLANVLQRDVLESKFVDVEKEDNNSLADSSKKEGKKLKLEGIIDGNDIRYSTMVRNASDLSGSEDSSNSWDDVKTSTSEGERSYIENIDRRHYNIELEDQISSESNTEEGIPSPTLLLQTRYTTFTYYTTVYTGGTSSNILSRLETLTNVVTETLSPTQVQKLDDATVPITYFTTFTYWTTFYKDGKTETTSREETVSNVITPSLVSAPQESLISTVDVISSLPTSIIQSDSTSSSTVAESTLLVQPLNPSEEPVIVESSSTLAEIIEPTQVAVNENEPSTHYTTYTYYTTNYVGDATVIDSRFETETNIVEPSAILSEQKTGARAIDVNSGNVNALDIDEKGKKKLIDGEKAVAEKKESIEATPALEIVNLMPTGIVSINHGKIIDAEGISTTHFTTKAIGSYVDKLYAEVIESSTSIEIDEIRKAIQPTELEGSTRHHKTGLVRLVDGTIVNKNITTLYESKVIGTFIDGRYAQLIESTSSIILAKQIEPTAITNHVNIEPTAANVVTPSSNDINPSPAVLEGSISESAKDDASGGESDDEDDGDEEDGRPRTRLSFQSKKKTFTPTIRPFASRPRPSFNPSRKNPPNGPAIITPTEITPTIKATAVKTAETTRNRFAGGRRSSAATSAFSPSSALASPAGPTSSRRSFGRPSSVRASFQPTSSIRPSSVRPSSARVQPTSALPGSIRRPGLLRSSLPIANRAPSSSIAPSLPAIGRNRVIRPSSTLQKEIAQASITTAEPDDFETTLVTDDPSNADDVESESQEPVTTTTENSRRNNNPLLRVRRPPLAGGRPNPPAPTQRSVTVTTRRNPLARTSRATTQATTSTTTERTTRNRPLFRPTFAPVQIGATRQRPSNLFPPRRSTTQAPQAIDEEEDENVSGEDYNEFEETKVKEVKTPAGKSRSGRSKRQAFDFGTRSPNYNPRFKKPTTSRNSRADYYTYESEEIIVTEAPKTRAATSRYSSRTRGNSNFETETAKSKIKPTTSSSQSNRLLFTLRKDDISPAVTPRSSNFRRPQPPSSSFNANNRRTTTTTRASNKFRYNQDPPRSSTNSNSNSRGRNVNTRRGTTSRSRTRDDSINYVAPKFDGTITVTHYIPTEVTIPIVVGKNTEYKSVITAKPSTEILGPKQYSTSTGTNGQSTLVIVEEKSSVNQNGQTEITHYYLSETPTTSITFTPTTIRGRKTSFSHVIPSTVYDAHPVVSTVQPQLLPSTGSLPLANILLSQLLLNQQNPALGYNPLLGLNPQIPQILPQMPATPVTEFKTRTTTYVTTIHEGKSTVLPITFRGSKILTTVFDEQSTVITATEFITDTVVITPTQAQIPQFQQNTANLQNLLLLLQQQQLNAGLSNVNTQPSPSIDVLKFPLDTIPDDKKVQSITPDETQNGSREEDYEDEKVEVKPVITKPKFKPHKPIERKYETSVVTIYVSGRTPGDFSTVLSTIVTENPVYKRSAAYVDVKASALPNLDVLEAEASDNYYEYVLSGSSNDIEPEPKEDIHKETESLDVVFGDFNKYTSSVLM